MASNPLTEDPPCNSDTEEETVALRKKRLRRVSFADVEITSVHIFNRDDDDSSGTPSNSSSSAAGKKEAGASSDDEEKDVIGFFRDLADSDDSKEILTPREGDGVVLDDDDDRVVRLRKSFLRPMESPSPGSSIAASSTCNDEDNFFGPVSASFIRPGRLSDSAASDDNHDITLDSTTFSMHFHSLARSVSGDLKTHTNHLAFEEKTPSHNTTPSDPGSSMALTREKIVAQSLFPIQTTNGRDSNDMSLVGENPRSYDYGKLSPGLEALLAQGSKDMHTVSASNSIYIQPSKVSQVSIFDKIGIHIDQKDFQHKEIGNVEGVSVDFMELDKANASVDHQIQPFKLQSQVQTPNQLSKDDHDTAIIGTSALDIDFLVDKVDGPTANGKVLQLGSFINEPTQLSVEGRAKEHLHNSGKTIYDADQSADKRHGSPIAGSISSLIAKRKQIFLDVAKSYEQLSNLTPSPKRAGSFNNKRKVGVVSSVNKSNSKFKIFEPSPLASTLKNGIEKTQLRLLKFSSIISPLTTGVEDSKDGEGTYVNAPIINLEKHLFNADSKSKHQEREKYVDVDGSATPKNIDGLSKYEEIGTLDLIGDGDSLPQMPICVPSEDRASQLTTPATSQSQFTWSQMKVSPLSLMPEKSTEGILVTSGSDSPLVEIKLVGGNDMKAISVADNGDKIISIKRSPNITKDRVSDLDFIMECSLESDTERKMIDDDNMVKHWSDISNKFQEDTKQLLSPGFGNLRIKEIDLFQDILVQLQKAKIYEESFLQFQSQIICDELSKIRHEREAQIRLLLFKLVYEKARLQVMTLKREKLVKRAQLRNSAIQECQMLKSNSVSHPSFLGGTDTLVNEYLQGSCLANSNRNCEIPNENVVRMRHELEILDKKIKKSTNSLHNYCKMKGEPWCSETIMLLNDHLKRKISCRFIREDLQLWAVDDFGSRNGQQHIVLNHQGLICQRFMINTTPNSRIFITHKLNNINIRKNFPNMDASVAFAYVLNAEINKKYLGFKSLAQETQITGLLLHNLLDVIEEVQLACIEIKNLVHTRFHCPSDEQLELQAVFIEFNCGRKVTVTLNLSCLKRGHYPSEILPQQLQVSIAGTHNSLPESLSTEIKVAVGGLSVGYSRILRLCRCVDQVMRSSST